MDAISVQPVCKYCANPQYDQSFKVTKFFTSGERYDPVGIWRNPDLTTQDNNCVEDCSILGLGFTNPSSFDISSLNTCGCQDGFFLNSSNKCESCTVFDAKCSKCSTTECTECWDSKTMLVNKACIPKIENCVIPFDQQPAKLTTVGTTKECPACIEGFSSFTPAKTTDKKQCVWCDKSIPFCSECSDQGRCTKCINNYIPNLNQTKCQQPFWNCNDKVEEYGNDGIDHVCRDCQRGYFWSSEERKCEECPFKLTDQGCLACGLEGTLCFECDSEFTWDHDKNVITPNITEKLILTPTRDGC